METVTMKSGYLHSSQPLCGGDNVAHGANEYFLFSLGRENSFGIIIFCILYNFCINKF